MLGSLSEADDAVQEAWLRLNGVDTASIENLTGWLTTVVSRVCLDMLRSRKLRRESPMSADMAEPPVAHAQGTDPEAEALLAEATGVALLVVLDALTPAERLAFVLHEAFAMPFEEIGRVLDRSAAAAKQLASRARRRVHGSSTRSDGDQARQRELVESFMTATRTGDINALLALLDPDAVIHIDAAARANDPNATEPGKPRELRGAATFVDGFIARVRGLRFVEPALIDGSVGVILAPLGKLTRAFLFTFDQNKVARIDVIGAPSRLRQLEITALRSGSIE
jgi:RNA polymerase sigma-70 factor (ECF subfamily)